MVEALLWPALAETVFISTPAISCKVTFVWRSECSVTIGSPALARDFCSHTRKSPGQISLPSSVQNSLSVSPSLLPRYFFWFCHQSSYSCKYSMSLSGIEIVRFELSVFGSLVIISNLTLLLVLVQIQKYNFSFLLLYLDFLLPQRLISSWFWHIF